MSPWRGSMKRRRGRVSASRAIHSCRTSRWAAGWRRPGASRWRWKAPLPASCRRARRNSSSTGSRASRLPRRKKTAAARPHGQRQAGRSRLPRRLTVPRRREGGSRGGARAKDAESQEQVLAAVQAQVKEGRALPLAEKQAAYHVALARQTAESTGGRPDHRGDRARSGARLTRRRIASGRCRVSGRRRTCRHRKRGRSRRLSNPTRTCGRSNRRSLRSNWRSRRKGGALAARRPRRAVRPVCQIQQLRRLLQQVSTP